MLTGSISERKDIIFVAALPAPPRSAAAGAVPSSGLAQSLCWHSAAAARLKRQVRAHYIQGLNAL